MADKQTGGPLECPRFAVNAFHTLASGTEITILCSSQVAGIGANGDIEAGSLPAVQLGVSPAVAKELIVLLQEQVDRHESENGEIVTPFLKAKSAK